MVVFFHPVTVRIAHEIKGPVWRLNRKAPIGWDLKQPCSSGGKTISNANDLPSRENIIRP